MGAECWGAEFSEGDQGDVSCGDAQLARDGLQQVRDVVGSDDADIAAEDLPVRLAPGVRAIEFAAVADVGDHDRRAGFQ